MEEGKGPSCYHIDEIEPAWDIKPRLKPLFPELYDAVEMSNYDMSFLCGLLRRKRPKRIVEAGVSAGGSSADMMYCLQEMGYDYEMYSIDVLDYAYRYPDKKAGFIAERAREEFGVKGHHLILGKSLPQCIDEVTAGGKIDFLLLDTLHSLPGEVLDFLVALPFLEDGAIVCMHDIRMNLNPRGNASHNATNALMNCVVAEKYVGEDEKRSFGYPNIGAFVVGSDTRKYIANVF